MTGRTWRFLVYFATLWAALAGLGGHVHGQGVVTRQVELPTAVTPGQTTGWHKIAPQRQVNDARLGKVLSDIESHMPAQHIYRDADLVTWAHETTHGINSNVRMATGAGTNAFYCLDGWVGVFREPRLRKSDVCRYVPANMRGDVWSLYMAGQTEWENQPLYILDEWVAYINGAKCGQELQASGQTGNRSIGHDVGHAYEMAGYASALMAAINQLDPNYPDKAKLAEFISFNVQRTESLAPNRKVAQCEGGACIGGWQPGPGSTPLPGPEAYTPPAPDPRVDQLVTAHNAWVQNQRQWNKVVVDLKNNVQASSCKCDGSTACKCDPSKTCSCDGKDAAAMQIEINALKVRIVELEKQKPQGFTAKIYDNGKLIGSREIKPGGVLPLERYLIGGQ